MNPIDLHTHTTESDGTDTPKELIDYALKKNLSAIAITDHDTIDGLSDAHAYAVDKPIELIDGIEFSTSISGLPFDIHILGYCFDKNDPYFLERLREIRHSRDQRNLEMIDKLSELGFPLTIEEVSALALHGVITRAHIGKAMTAKGYIKDEQIAYKKYIGNNGPAYVPRKKLTPKMAIELILSAGGVPVIAHPTLYKMKVSQLDLLIKNLSLEGLKGIEAVYSLHAPHEECYLREIAKKYDLIITGGSDYHGNNKKYIDLGVGKGKLYVDDQLLGPLKEASAFLSKGIL